MLIEGQKTILIVDDQPENLQAIVDMFSSVGDDYNILKAPNGKIALRVIEGVNPDLIITDWEMPVMDGIEFIRELKKNETTADIPVIMCTGVMITSENLKKALSVGAIDYIRKPVDKIELIARTKASLHLAEKYQEIKNLNHTKDRFLSIIAHDLKGPFNNIIGLADLMMDNCSECALSKDTQEINSLISYSAKSAYDLLVNLLDWAKLQRGDFSYQPERHLLKDKLNDIIEFTSQIAAKKNIKVSLSCEDDAYAVFDKNMIDTITRNILLNAIKFTNEGGTVNIFAKNRNNLTQIDIIDNGVGMSSKEIGYLFRIDKKFSKCGTANEKGTGLGLIICKELIVEHGGKVWVESKVGSGSKFSFTIPQTEIN